jgi:hypothetical protein
MGRRVRPTNFALVGVLRVSNLHIGKLFTWQRHRAIAKQTPAYQERPNLCTWCCLVRDISWSTIEYFRDCR